MKIYTDIIQRSAEWHALRMGKITATHFDTLANGKPVGIRKLCWETAKERIDRCAAESIPINNAMQWGIDHEDEAIAKFEWDSGFSVDKVGFVEYNDYFGFSPDGLIDDNGGMEIKCPQKNTYDNLAKKKAHALDWMWIPSKHRWQIQASLYILKGKFWYYVVYYPGEKLLVETVKPDDESFHKIEVGIKKCEDWIRNIVLAYAA